MNKMNENYRIDMLSYVNYFLSLSHEDFFKIAKVVVDKKMSIDMAIKEFNREETDESR